MLEEDLHTLRSVPQQDHRGGVLRGRRRAIRVVPDRDAGTGGDVKDEFTRPFHPGNIPRNPYASRITCVTSRQAREGPFTDAEASARGFKAARWHADSRSKDLAVSDWLLARQPGGGADNKNQSHSDQSGISRSLASFVDAR
ncbi:hypothetical protein GCM10027360_42420 [Amycolatopsis echigonensis]